MTWQRKGEYMTIIDMRSRPPFGRYADQWVFNVEDSEKGMGLARKFANMDIPMPDSILHKSMQHYLREMDEAGIQKAVVPLRKSATLDNGDLLSLLNAWPDRFIGFIGVRPMADPMEQILREIDDLIVNGPCHGVIMEPGIDPVPWKMDDERVFPVYEKCEQEGIPLNILLGGVFHRPDAPDSGYYSPLLAEHVARVFPKLHILLSHAGWPWTVAACAAAINWDNIWLAPDSYLINHPGAQDYVVGANYRLQDKFLFGSTYPASPMQYTVDQCRVLIRQEVQEKFFYRNAEAFLNIQL